ncbi:MAG: hypothetical protein MUF08_01445 [Burkholderiaceae bacterium]|nr:hypothetical protein [Burkholderiaceae bacterium]
MDPRLKRLYWQATALLLATHLSGWAPGLALAVALNAVQAAHFALHRRSLQAFDVQVRIGYLALLLIGSVGPLWPIHVVQFVGVNAMLVADYCLLARLLVLLPWNRRTRFSPSLLRWALCSPAMPGAITDRVPV